jgi:hypothetical protein
VRGENSGEEQRREGGCGRHETILAVWALLLAATFHGLGDLPGGEFRSEALVVP